jgi:hypothetical protein
MKKEKITKTVPYSVYDAIKKQRSRDLAAALEGGTRIKRWERAVKVFGNWLDNVPTGKAHAVVAMQKGDLVAFEKALGIEKEAYGPKT